MKTRATERVVIIGGGPAGLTAALRLVQQHQRPLVLEALDKPGGLARTETYRGYHFDIGGHRFYTKVREVRELWEAMLGEDFRLVPRQSRIYYKGRFYKYPLEPFNALSNLGVWECVRTMLSYFKSRVWPHPDEDTLEQWVTNRFGGRLYETFFKTYTEKVWGIPCDRIRADWAAQRIKGLSLKSAITHALFGRGDATSLISEFQYPRRGPGMMWEKVQRSIVAGGGQVELNTEAIELSCHQQRITRILTHSNSHTTEFRGRDYISSMPLNLLVTRINPSPPSEVLEAVGRLSYRDFILVGLIVKREHVFPDNWIYIHAPEVRVGRIQNFKNWSRDMVPDQSRTSLGMEYFCTQGDVIWAKSDAELIELATHELLEVGLVEEGDVEDGVVIRQPQAYPVYSDDYRQNVAVIRRYLDSIDNLQTIGRNGMHRYNNQDHSMLTGMGAARNLRSRGSVDLWGLNTDRSYSEDSSADDRLPEARQVKLDATPIRNAT